jgi:hypothetical protein
MEGTPMMKYGKAIMTALGVIIVSLQPEYGKYAWFVALPATYSAVAVYMSAPNVLPANAVPPKG